MPLVNNGPMQAGQDAPNLYGVDKVENTIPFQERLMRLFKPQEFVTIKNIDDEPVYWQYMPIDNETETFSEDGMQRQINRTTPEMWMIAAGETEVLVGASAYRALDVLYKNVTAKKTLRRYTDPLSPRFDDKNQHLPKNFNFADGGAQEEFIKLAYLGKAVPTFADYQPVDVTPQVATPATANTMQPTYAEPDLPEDAAVTAARKLVKNDAKA